MDIWDFDKLTLFITFVIPGFISIKCYELFFPNNKDASDRLIDAISYSSINYALLMIPIIIIEKSNIKNSCPLTYYIFYIFVFFIAPVIWVIVWKKLRTSKLFQKNVPHPTLKPWDYVFAQQQPYWIKLILKDGTIIAGLYADRSFASSSPAQEQIYLEQTWILNDKGGFERAKNDTAGVIVLSNEISHIELRNYWR